MLSPYFVHRVPRFRACAVAFPALLMVSPLALADEQLILQQQRQKALEQQLLPPTPDIRLQPNVDQSGKLAPVLPH